MLELVRGFVVESALALKFCGERVMFGDFDVPIFSRFLVS